MSLDDTGGSCNPMLNQTNDHFKTYEQRNYLKVCRQCRLIFFILEKETVMNLVNQVRALTRERERLRRANEIHDFVNLPPRPRIKTPAIEMGGPLLRTSQSQ